MRLPTAFSSSLSPKMSANPKQNAPRVAPPPSTLAGIGDARQTGAVSTGRAPMSVFEPTPVANPRMWAFPLVAISGRSTVLDQHAPFHYRLCVFAAEFDPFSGGAGGM